MLCLARNYKFIDFMFVSNQYLEDVFFLCIKVALDSVSCYPFVQGTQMLQNHCLDFLALAPRCAGLLLLPDSTLGLQALGSCFGSAHNEAPNSAPVPIAM